jgi:hypothetical protein
VFRLSERNTVAFFYPTHHPLERVHAILAHALAASSEHEIGLFLK